VINHKSGTSEMSNHHHVLHTVHQSAAIFKFLDLLIKS